MSPTLARPDWALVRLIDLPWSVDQWDRKSLYNGCILVWGEFTLDEAPQRHPLLQGIDIGIGTWAWGDRLYWGYGRGYSDVEIRAAFDRCLEAGVRLFDTAEVYGQGQSETLL